PPGARTQRGQGIPGGLHAAGARAAAARWPVRARAPRRPRQRERDRELRRRGRRAGAAPEGRHPRRGERAPRRRGATEAAMTASHIPPDDPATRGMLRHVLATLAYRAGKTVRGTPEAFADFMAA